MDLIEDTRLEKPELCRVTEMVGIHEFICINPVHAGPDTTHMLDPRGGPAQWRRHYMVRRYPFGDH